MPQFNFVTYSSQIFWLLVSFGIFFAYVKFYFLPKLESILVKRNTEIEETQKLIAENNRQAKENFHITEENIKNTNALADKIISDAEAKARFDEEQVLEEMRQAQKKIIADYLEKQKLEFSQEVVDKAVVDSAQIVLKKIGIDVPQEELFDMIKNQK